MRRFLFYNRLKTNKGAFAVSVSEKIYNLRTKNGFTQEVFAEKLDVPRQSVQKRESGLSLPTIDSHPPICI